MKINIINFDNLDKYQRLIKTLSTLSMKTRLCLKGTFTLSALTCFDLSFKNWTILRIISNSSKNLNLNRGCVCFSYQIFFVTVDLRIYPWSKCMRAYFNEILLNFFYRNYGLRQPCLKIIFSHVLCWKFMFIRIKIKLGNCSAKMPPPLPPNKKNQKRPKKRYKNKKNNKN